MSADRPPSEPRFDRVMRLFAEACELPPQERGAYLDGACGDDVTVRSEVEELLACDAGVDDRFLTRGAGQERLARAIAPGVVDGAGSQRSLIGSLLGGKYRITRKIGEGGMGEVFEAEQTMPKRRVAIKLMRPGLSSARALRRFEHEAHVLGRLQHPGIAQIYEVGAVSPDRPDDAFFAMELVDGVPVTEFADRAQLDITARVELIERLCEAVQHAHQRGVIHRDLKPANILVESTADGAGRPKILDFGVARVATDEEEHPSRQLTDDGQIIGTLAYMSPEQVAGKPDEIDVRVDVYALGVILYQLLAGRLPLDTTSGSLAEALRLIRERDPPALGSLRRELRGDLETIAMRALEKSPERRYQSAAELADDLRRSRLGEPIVARQHSAIYVGRKFIRRHPVASVAASLIVVGSVLFALFATTQAERFRELADEEHALRLDVDAARAQAERLREQADDAARSLAEELTRSDIDRGRLLASLGNVGPAEELLWPALFRDPDSLGARYGLRETYRRQGLTSSTRIGGKLACVSMQDDGTIVAGDEEGHITAVDQRAGRISARAEVGERIVGIDASSPHAVVVVGASGTLTLLRPTTLERLDAPALVVTRAFAASPSGERLVAMHPDRRLLIHELPSLRPVWSSEPLKQPCHVIAWRRDGSEFAISGNETVVSVFTVEGPGASTQPVLRMEGHASGVAALAWSPDGRSIWSGSADRTLRRWDRERGVERSNWRFGNGTIRYLLVSADGSLVATAGWWALDLLDAETGQRIAQASPTVGATGLAFAGEAGDARLVTTVHPDGFLRSWHFTHTRNRRFLEPVQGPARSAFTTGLPLRVAVGGADGIVRIDDPLSGATVTRTAPLGQSVRTLHFADQDQTLLALANDGQVHAIDTRSGSVRASLRGPSQPQSALLDVSPDGTIAALGLSSGNLRVFDARTLAVLREEPANVGALIGVNFAPDGTHLAAIGRAKAVTIRTYDLVEVARSEADVGTPWQPVFSPDGRMLAAGTWSEHIQLWSFPDLAVGRKLLGHRALPWLLRFDPRDSRILRSAGEDGQFNVWNVSDGALLTSDEPFAGGDVTTFDLSPDGRYAALGSAAGEVVVIDLDADDLAVARNLEAAIDTYGRDADPALLARVRAWADGVMSGGTP